MGAMKWTGVVAAAVLVAVVAAPAQAKPRQYRPGDARGVLAADSRDDYNRGYQQGLKEGEKDARKNRPYQPTPNGNGRWTRDADFRSGFAAGYRVGYDQSRRPVVGRRDRDGDGDRDRDDRRIDRNDRRQDGILRRVPGGYQEPATARGYSDGYQRGLDDGRDRRRYDPVGERDYREADQGYYGGYGSKDAYKNNYRAGFRQGYEDGYRDGNLRGR